MNRRNSVAFTLIELLIVIATIGILVALLFPVFSSRGDNGANGHVNILFTDQHAKTVPWEERSKIFDSDP